MIEIDELSTSSPAGLVAHDLFIVRRKARTRGIGRPLLAAATAGQEESLVRSQTEQ